MSFPDLVKLRKSKAFMYMYPRQDLDTQILAVEAFAFLDIVDYKFSSYIDSTLDGIYYQEKISVVKKYIVSSRSFVELRWGRTL